MMKVMGWAVILAAFLVMPLYGQATSAPTASATMPAGPDDAVLKEIAEIRDGMVGGVNKGDLDKVLTYLHPEIVVTWANAEVSHGPGEVRAYYDKMMHGPNKIVESMSCNPTVEGRKMYGENVMISYGTLGDSFKLTDGKEFTLNCRFSSLLVKENGKWLLKGFHSSANVFDNPVLGIAIKKVALWTGLGAGAAGALVGFLAARMMRKKA